MGCGATKSQETTSIAVDVSAQTPQSQQRAPAQLPQQGGQPKQSAPSREQPQPSQQQRTPGPQQGGQIQPTQKRPPNQPSQKGAPAQPPRQGASQPSSQPSQKQQQQQQQQKPQGAGGNPVLDKFREDVLAAHNKRRQWHRAPPVKLSDELNATAQKWADHLAKVGRFEHSSKEHRNGAGENIAAHSNIIAGEEVVEMWYSEIKDYDFSKPGFAGNTGHFTQVVWKNCTHIGAGMSSERGSNGMYTYVANYWPHGNMMGDFENNVFPKS